MRIPRGPIDNPDVIDQRGASPIDYPLDYPPVNAPSEADREVDDRPSWDGVSPVVLKSDAKRAVHATLALSGAVAIGAFFLGRASVSSTRTVRRKRRSW